jgi:hypothetical protein
LENNYTAFILYINVTETNVTPLRDCPVFLTDTLIVADIDDDLEPEISDDDEQDKRSNIDYTGNDSKKSGIKYDNSEYFD